LVSKDSSLNFVPELREFASKDERVRRARTQLEKFAKRFPFRDHPEMIQDLGPSSVYEKGSRDSFFYWVEFGTYDVGHITVYDASNFEDTKTDLPTLKDLLKTAVDNSLKLYEKVDAPWDKFRGFGGDRHIPKKIIALMYPENVLPIFNTNHFEYISSRLGLDLDRIAKSLFQKDYEESTVGEKFQAFNQAISKWRQENCPEVDSLALARFLYEKFPPPSREITRLIRDRAGVLSFSGLLFEPENELGVVSIFSMYHRELGFPFIVKIQNGFPDATVVSDEGESVVIEFEYKASGFIQHGHPARSCDLIVCWENDLSENPGPAVLALKDRIKDIMKNRFLGES
jgi:hypothetical protein